MLFFVACRDSSLGPGGTVLRERWYRVQSGYGRARPAVNNQTVYFGTGAGQVIARDIATGSVLWATTASADAIDGANLIVRANIVVAASVVRTVALNAATGAVLWKYDAPSDTVGIEAGAAGPGSVIDARIDADNDMVYIPAWGASVSAVDLRTGVLRWVWQPGHLVSDTGSSGIFRSGSMGVRVSGDTLFATMWHFTNSAGGTSEAWLVALDRNAGTELSKVRLPLEGSGVLMQAAPALYHNFVIVHTISAHTYAVDRTSQQVVWEFTATNSALSTLAGPEVSGDVVYVDGGDGQIYALHASDGTVIWRGMFGTATSRDMLLTDRHIIFPTGAELHILDRASGNQIAVTVQPHTTDPLFASPAASAQGLVFTTVGDGAWCFEDPPSA